LKIGCFINHFPYKINKINYTQYWCGGSGNAAYYLATHMALRGHEINVFTTSINSKASIERYENIVIYRYPTNFKIKNASISFGMFKNAPRFKIDILHAHLTNSVNEFIIPRYKKKKNIPLVVTYHGDPEKDMGGFIYKVSVSFYVRYLLDKILSLADIIISPSEHYINESRYLKKYRDKIEVIPNGINIEDFNVPLSKEECREKLGLPLDGNVILFVGKLSPYKGLNFLLEAMPKILKKVPKVKLVFIGEGEIKKKLETLSKKLNIEKSVEFTGFVENNLKAMYYRAADVFVLPSTMRTESFGIVNLEAMACGIPIVASRIGGIPSIVKNGENGLLVPPKDVEALADAIIYLLENENLRQKMGERGKKRVKSYSWDRIAEMTEKVYEKVVRDRNEKYSSNNS